MIHILWATIRPQMFNVVYKMWLERSSNKDIITHVAVNSQADANIVKQVLGKNDEVIIITSDRKGVCYPSYILSSKLEAKANDIVIFASDDFMAPQGWDTYLLNKFNGKEDVGLMVRDGYQLPDSSNMLHAAITIPIMTYGCLKKLNMTIYHPAYNHMFSDCELYNNLKDLSLLYDDRINDTTIFEHLHYAAGKRNADGADQAYNAKWKDDEITWNKRKLLPVEERIKI